MTPVKTLGLNALQMILGLGLVAAPWMYDGLAQSYASWAVMLSGALVALAAFVRLIGLERPGAGASLPAGLAALATAMLPYTWAIDGLVWNLVVTGLVSLAAVALFHRRRPVIGA